MRGRSMIPRSVAGDTQKGSIACGEQRIDDHASASAGEHAHADYRETTQFGTRPSQVPRGASNSFTVQWNLGTTITRRGLRPPGAEQEAAPSDEHGRVAGQRLSLRPVLQPGVRPTLRGNRAGARLHRSAPPVPRGAGRQHLQRKQRGRARARQGGVVYCVL